MKISITNAIYNPCYPSHYYIRFGGDQFNVQIICVQGFIFIRNFIVIHA